MSSKKSNGSRKDPLKTPKVWERARREKMKIYFNELQEVLPFYDPSAPMSRFEILQKSKMYIKDLQDQNQDLLNGGFDEVYKVKMVKLKQRVKELLKRVDQLTDLLRTANIMIPPLEAYPKTPNTFKWMSQHPKKWTEKINLVVPDDKIKNVLTLIKDYKKNNKVKLKKRQLNKTSDKLENSNKDPKITTKKKKWLKNGSKVINLKVNKVAKDAPLRSSSPSQFKENQPVDFNSITNDGGKKTGSEQSDATKCTSSTSQVAETSPTVSKIIPQNVILPSASGMLQSNTFILTNDGNLVQLPVLNQTGTAVLSNSNILTQGAIVKPNTGLLTPVVINKPSPVIVLQKPSPQIIKTQIINPAPQVIVSKPNVQILGANIYGGAKLPHLLSKTPSNKKRITRDSTVTTYVNKIPIPALSKQSYAKKSLVSKKEKPKEGEKPAETKTNENEDDENEKVREKEEAGPEIGEKRAGPDEENIREKKQKQDGNVFKPIESDNGVYCNLELPNPMNPSVSPTAAFLSSFPIVAPTRPEVEDDPKADDKDSKTDSQVDGNKVGADAVKETVESNKEIVQEKEKTNDPKVQQTTQLDLCKSWEQFQSTENFYIPSENVTPLENITPVTYSNTNYKAYNGKNMNVQNHINEQVKNSQFEYVQKENYINKSPAYSKPCTNMADAYSKNYQIDPAPNYQLIPVKERNQRTVNWMTEPDVSNRVAYPPQNDKIKAYPQPESFFNNQPAKGDYYVEQNKMQYQYGKDQRCKNIDKRTDKCYTKAGQNYNIFDYNYPGGCYGDDSNKYCQTYGKGKKPVPQKKKELEEQTDQKRSEQSIIDFNPSNQECFTWVPGKNVDWMPGKSFSLDSNLVVPSTLPTLVGDLALGTSTDTSQKNPKPCQKDDFGMGKPLETDGGKYFEPFANLSKNIFDVTNVNNQTNNFNNNETIVLKNIFELPVSKSSEFSRKQRAVNNQNTFLSVSQLVEPPTFEGLKNEHLDATKTTTDGYYLNYNQKTYKKPRNCKYDRKYHGYKNAGSSYTAEALIRNTNAGYQPNEYPADGNFFNGKANQKVDQFALNVEINVKSDFSAGQNLYSDFNFSSPVPNFTIGSTVTTDFGSHDTSGNFASQNSSFFGDFITPEYPLSENVSNSLLLPPCSIGLQNPFVIDKRNPEKAKNAKPYSRNRKHFETCAKTTYNEFSLTSTAAIFTTAAITCPTILTTSQNLLPVPTQSMPISFSSPSFSTSNISFPALSSASNNNHHRFPATCQTNSLLPSNPMFTTCTSKPLTSQNCYSTSSLTTVTNSVISSFPVGNAPLPTSQSSIPFFSLSNPIIPSSAPTSSSNSLANFNLSTIFPEINQKGPWGEGGNRGPLQSTVSGSSGRIRRAKCPGGSLCTWPNHCRMHFDAFDARGEAR